MMTNVVLEGMTHEVARPETELIYGATRCNMLFAARTTRYAVSRGLMTTDEIDCMACVAGQVWSDP